VVLDVESNTYANRFGFRPGDRLVKINSQRIHSVKGTLKAFRSTRGWSIEIDRNGKLLQIQVK